MSISCHNYVNQTSYGNWQLRQILGHHKKSTAICQNVKRVDSVKILSVKCASSYRHNGYQTANIEQWRDMIWVYTASSVSPVRICRVVKGHYTECFSIFCVILNTYDHFLVFSPIYCRKGRNIASHPSDK